jgi:hypothetical protein
MSNAHHTRLNTGAAEGLRPSDVYAGLNRDTILAPCTDHGYCADASNSLPSAGDGGRCSDGIDDDIETCQITQTVGSPDLVVPTVSANARRLSIGSIAITP